MLNQETFQEKINRIFNNLIQTSSFMRDFDGNEEEMRTYIVDMELMALEDEIQHSIRSI